MPSRSLRIDVEKKTEKKTTTSTQKAKRIVCSKIRTEILLEVLLIRKETWFLRLANHDDYIRAKYTGKREGGNRRKKKKKKKKEKKKKKKKKKKQELNF